MAVSRLGLPIRAANTTIAEKDVSADAPWTNAGGSAPKACSWSAATGSRNGLVSTSRGCWISRVLVALVAICLAMAAWVWLDILLMGH
jgi:hypothetical protein